MRVSVTMARRSTAGAFVLIASACLTLGGVARAAEAGAAHLLGVRFGGDRQATRVVIDLDGPIHVRAGRDDDGRSRLELPGLAVDEAQHGAGRGLVKAWTATGAGTGAHFELELAAGAKIGRRFLIPPSDGTANYRYVIDVVPEPIELAAVTPRAAVPAAPLTVEDLPNPNLERSLRDLRLSPPAAPAIARVATRPARPAVAMTGRTEARHRLKVIVVDAGHGGHDSGALGATKSEKDLTLAAAKTLKTCLERSGRYRVVLTRDSDAYVPLETRVKIARQGGADLFLSLHADSAGADPTTHGASVYTLSDTGGGRVHYVLGRDEWFTRISSRADPGVGQILLDLTQRSTRNRSAVFAGLLLEQLAGRVDLLPRSHRDAGYFVLLAPDVPAALLEMGFITNPDDETRLADAGQRARMMEGVAQAIDAYFGEATRVVAAS